MVLSSVGLSCSDAVGAAVFDARGLGCRGVVNASCKALRRVASGNASGSPSEVPPLALDEVRARGGGILLGRAGFPAAAYSGALIVDDAAGAGLLPSIKANMQGLSMTMQNSSTEERHVADGVSRIQGF